MQPTPPDNSNALREPTLPPHAENPPAIGRTDDADASTIGLVVFHAGSEEEARQIMEVDPAVDEGLLRGELRRFRLVHPRVE